jgi:AraC-like DNA-binding protein
MIDVTVVLLERALPSTSVMPMEIFSAAGMSFFRRLFRRHTGVSPRAYRARFGPRPLRAIARAPVRGVRSAA